MPQHMDRAWLIFEKEEQTYRFKVTERQYREFVKTNPALEHHLECPDHRCNGRVHAHTEARTRRKGAEHAYTEKGFSHNPHTASDNCRYSFKNDPRFAGLPDSAAFLAQTKEQVGKAFDFYRKPLLKDLQMLLGAKEDAAQHFDRMRALFAEHEFYATHVRAAPFVYVTKLPPFEMALKNGKTITATYLEDDQQAKDFNSLRGHTRTEILPKAAQLVYSPSLMPVLTYRFDIDVSGGDVTKIWRITAPVTLGRKGVQSVKGIEVRPDEYVRTRMQRPLKFG